ncbi:hypothetical protein HJC22_12835 [Corallococcus exiguus]|uniref:hypothetical protein n=1 Tax=Corallococcus TaxID=83461 RepID=UPI000EA22124|nr:MULTISPECIES: hypothetical protein [Corallococcus]NNC16605.1 hypothetical protein [Corallococcus exiguus]NRD51659.1 hypothetical protein [Corallococcus exiguus]RKH30185.1 hypothetical protein D7V77_03800 [Corallococcus sp. CA041A]RKI19264.1 hypothetical protein D7Y15_05050 [Corallococcus sp. AB030]RUO93694.1 hypothetical protein D7Y11_08315 [Corallococcus sp. AB018]
MDLTLRDEVNRLLSPDMNITGLGDVSVDWQSQGAGVQARFPDLHGIRQEISYMSLSEAKQAGITLYGDASFSIDAYPVERFQGFAHFVAAVIVQEVRRSHCLQAPVDWQRAVVCAGLQWPLRHPLLADVVGPCCLLSWTHEDRG